METESLYQFSAHVMKRKGKCKSQDCEYDGVLDKNQLALQKHFETGGHPATQNYHVKCLFAYYVMRARPATKRIENIKEIDGYEQLTKEQQNEIEQYIKNPISAVPKDQIQKNEDGTYSYIKKSRGGTKSKRDETEGEGEIEEEGQSEETKVTKSPKKKSRTTKATESTESTESTETTESSEVAHGLTTGHAEFDEAAGPLRSGIWYKLHNSDEVKNWCAGVQGKIYHCRYGGGTLNELDPSKMTKNDKHFNSTHEAMMELRHKLMEKTRPSKNYKFVTTEQMK